MLKVNDSGRTVIFGYIGCKGKEFFGNGAEVGWQRLQTLGDRLSSLKISWLPMVIWSGKIISNVFVKE